MKIKQREKSPKQNKRNVDYKDDFNPFTALSNIHSSQGKLSHHTAYIPNASQDHF